MAALVGLIAGLAVFGFWMNIVGNPHVVETVIGLAISVNAYERDTRARKACIEHYGDVCFVCGFDFAAKYGDLGRGYIHVHHLVPLSAIRASYVVDPVRDLRPVCPNCHAMLHRMAEVLSVEALRRIVRK